MNTAAHTTVHSPFVDNKGHVRRLWSERATKADELKGAIIAWLDSRLPGSASKRGRALIAAGEFLQLAVTDERATDPQWFFNGMECEIDRIIQLKF